MKTKRWTAILLSAILAYSVCTPVNSISAYAAKRAAVETSQDAFDKLDSVESVGAAISGEEGQEEEGQEEEGLAEEEPVEESPAMEEDVEDEDDVTDGVFSEDQTDDGSEDGPAQPVEEDASADFAEGEIQEPAEDWKCDRDYESIDGGSCSTESPIDAHETSLDVDGTQAGDVSNQGGDLNNESLMDEAEAEEAVTSEAMGTAVDSGTCGDQVTWSLTGVEGAYTLTIKGSGSMNDYNTRDPSPWCGRSDIKAIIVEPGITHIGDYTFEGLQAADSVSLPDGIISIGGAAFYYCQSLQEIVLPSSVRELGGSVFCACTSLKSMAIPDGVKVIENSSFYSCYALESVTIPDSVTAINEAFMHCKSLKSISLPPNITYIYYCCFCECESLEEITIPDNVTRIGAQAFQGCMSLKKINIGKNVSEIGDGAFSGCDSLEDFSLSAENPYFSSDQGVLFNKDYSELKIYPIAKKDVSYTVRSSVKTIANGAFSENNYIQTVVLPESVHTIGEGAFSNCKDLKSINIPSEITVIDDYTFAWCYQLNHITLPEGLTRIGKHAFQSCFALSKITIPPIVEFIGSYAFGWCRSMTEAEFRNRTFYIRGATTIPGNVLIKGYANSDSEKYAIAYGRSFLNLESQQKMDYQANNQRYIDMLPTSGITASGPVAIGNDYYETLDGRFIGYGGDIAFEKPENGSEYREILAKVSELTQGSDDCYEHARSIANWVSSYISYRYGFFTDCSIESIFGLWRRKTGNCMSYSMLLNYMLYLDGIPSLTLSSGDHQWSGALIDGRWVMIDATNNRFDFVPNNADDIKWISFADGPLMVVVDDMLHVSLGGISESYLQTRNLQTVTIPAYINKCYEHAFSDIPKGAIITGELGTESYQYVKNKYPCVAEQNDCYYAYSDGHSWNEGVITKAATITSTGVKTFTCTRCSATREEDIPKLSNVKLKTENVIVADGKYVFNGKEHQPAVTVTYDGKQFVDGTDYTVVYGNNIYAGQATVTVIGMGVFTGTVIMPFKIDPASIADAAVTGIVNRTYTGLAQTQNLTVKMGNRTLENGVDYELSYSNNTGIGTATVTITGIGNYTGGVSKTFTIRGISIEDAEVTGISDRAYDGSAQTQDPKVRVGGKTLVNGTDYMLSYSDNVDIGTATVTITGKGNYTGSVSRIFTIGGISIADAVVTGISNKTYTGFAQTQDPVVMVGDKTLSKDADYTISYSDNIDAGTATMTIAGKGNYAETVVKTFTIAPASIESAIVTEITDRKYDGSAQTQNPVVKMGDKTLADETDYTISYSDNINAGTVTVTVTGKGNYNGTKSASFTIEKASQMLEAASLSLTYPDGGKITTAGNQGTLSYTSLNTAVATVDDSGSVTAKGAGTAKIRITASATDNYNEVVKEITVTVEKGKQVISAKASAASVAVGKKVNVSATGAHGKVTYKSSDTSIATVNSSSGAVTAKKVGTVKITVTAAETEDYNVASAKVTIKVVPTATTSLTAENQAKGIKLTWKKVTGATGFLVYRGSSKIATIKSGSILTYTDTKASNNGTKYTYKVVATASTGNSTLSKSLTTHYVAAPTAKTAKSTVAKKADVTWSKNTKASGYEIEYSLKKNFSGPKKVTVTKTATVKTTLTGLTGGKTYYVRIRAYIKSGNTQYYSAWSAAKTVAIKK